METVSDLISVIVPVFKVEQYLDQCIDSIVHQTYRRLEIILIDDGSPDRCPEICDRWAEKDPRIYVIHQENSGVSKARNAGIERAKGSYIVFVDSDDYLEPVYIEYLYRAVCETDADLSECRYTRDPDTTGNADDCREMSRPVLQTAEDALEIWCHPDPENFNLVVWNKMYRRELITGELFAEGYTGGEDVLFTCRVFGKCRKIACIDNELYHWRDTPGSASKVFPDNMLHMIELLFPALDDLAENNPSVASQCKIHMCRLITGFFYELQYESDLDNKNEVKEKMLSFRRRIHFSFREWARCTRKEKHIILCSGASFSGIYIRMRHYHRRISGMLKLH